MTTATAPTTTCPPGAGPRILAVGTLRADLDGRRLWVDGAPLPLTRRPFDTLVALMDNAGRVMSQRELRERIATRHRTPDSTAIATHIKVLRRSLAAHPAALARLRTVHGLGYTLDLDAPSATPQP